MAESETQVTRKDFRQEIAECWHRLPDKALFFGLLAAWLGLFQFLGSSTFGYTDSPSLFRWMWNAYNAPFSEDGHGNLIPLVVLGLFWWKRRELMETSKQIWWPALVLVIGALLLHIVGYVVQQARLSIVALFCGIYGLTGLVWGKQWLQKSFFPFILFIFCVPIGSLAESITFPLRVLVTKISVFISQFALGIDVIPKGTQIFEPKGRFQYDVAVACSGIRSLVSLIALTTIYGFITFKASWKRVLMVLIAFPLAVAGNVVRITGVIIAGEAFGQEVGLKVHDVAGFVTFAVAIICVMILTHWLREDRPQVLGSERATNGRIGNVRMIRQKSFLAGVSLLLIVGTAGFLLDLKANQKLGNPGLKVTQVAGSNEFQVDLPERVGAYVSESIKVTEQEIEVLPKDTTFGRRGYQSPDGFGAVVSVVLMGSDRTSIHKPQFCLRGQGWIIDQSESTTIPISKPDPYELPVMKLTSSQTFKGKNGETAKVRRIYIYWFVSESQLTGQHAERMWWMARELIQNGVLQRWAYVTVSADCLPGQEEKTYERLKEFISLSVPEFQLTTGHKKAVPATAPVTAAVR